MRTTSASENRIGAHLAPHSHALLLLAVLMLLGLAGPLAAQERKGLFVGFGLGWGSLDLTCDGCEVDPAVRLQRQLPDRRGGQ